MNIQELTDNDLNRAIIWLHPTHYNARHAEAYGPARIENRLRYLTDWSLTGPLMVKCEIDLWVTRDDKLTCEVSLNHRAVYIMEHKNPLRAICECILAIHLQKA